METNMDKTTSPQQERQSSHCSNVDGQTENVKASFLPTDSISMEGVEESGRAVQTNDNHKAETLCFQSLDEVALTEKHIGQQDCDSDGPRSESASQNVCSPLASQTDPCVDINVQSAAECLTPNSNVFESVLSTGETSNVQKAAECLTLDPNMSEPYTGEDFQESNTNPQALHSPLASMPQTLSFENSGILRDSSNTTEKTVGHTESSQTTLSHGDFQHQPPVVISTNDETFVSLPESVTVGEAVQVSEHPSREIREEQNHSAIQPSVSEVAKNDSRYALSSMSSMECVGIASACFHRRSNDNFLKGCKWSPDGSQMITNSNDNLLRVFNTEQQEMQKSINLNPSHIIKEQSLVYDFCWNPRMSSAMPDTCQVACTCSNIPIHLWDSSSGKLVASYRAFDHYDEIIAAYSLAFSPDGSKIFAGYKKSIRIFDTARPGRTCSLLKTFDPQTKEGVPGIISCFTFSQDASPVFVAGSYSRHVGVYDYASQQLVYMMQGQQGGVTHVMLSPDGTKLYTGGRKDPEIVCWDMRNTGTVLFTCLRDVQTNQRIYFDLSESGQYLISGNHDGTVVLWDTSDPGQSINGETIIKPCYSFLAHQDCVNGVSFNHKKGLLATTSGQRHFMNFEDYDSDSSSSTMSIDGDGSQRDYSLKWWKIPCNATTNFVT